MSRPYRYPWLPWHLESQSVSENCIWFSNTGLICVFIFPNGVYALPFTFSLQSPQHQCWSTPSSKCLGFLEWTGFPRISQPAASSLACVAPHAPLVHTIYTLLYNIYAICDTSGVYWYSVYVACWLCSAGWAVGARLCCTVSGGHLICMTDLGSRVGWPPGPLLLPGAFFIGLIGKSAQVFDEMCETVSIYLDFLSEWSGLKAWWTSAGVWPLLQARKKSRNGIWSGKKLKWMRKVGTWEP